LETHGQINNFWLKGRVRAHGNQKSWKGLSSESANPTTTLLKLELSKDKNIYALKTPSGCLGVVSNGETLYFTAEFFDSPLKAANAARKLKKEKGISTKTKKLQNSSVVKNTTTIAKITKLYTLAEMGYGPTKLKFREVWLLMGPSGSFVSETLNKTEKKVVKYEDNKDKAKRYRSYEEASLDLKVLDNVIKKGHSLIRFFEKTA